MEQRKRAANGTFLKGQPSPEGARRVRGTLNKITSDIKNGCIEGFTKHGFDGRGKDGFPGYIRFLAAKHPKAACRIIEKLLPLNVNATGMANQMIGSIRIVSVPSGHFLSAAQIEHASNDPHDVIEGVPYELPAQLEHASIAPEYAHAEPAPITEHEWGNLSPEEIRAKALDLIAQVQDALAERD
jgi:hypothetical protein